MLLLRCKTINRVPVEFVERLNDYYWYKQNCMHKQKAALLQIAIEKVRLERERGRERKSSSCCTRQKRV